MFMYVNPSKKLTPAERQRVTREIRSRAAIHGHQRREKTRRAREVDSSQTVELRRLGSNTRSTVNARSQQQYLGLTTSGDIPQSSKEDDWDSWQLPPALQLSPTVGTSAEKRSLHYFTERTALEWSAWSDDYFWTMIVTQASSVHSCLRHGLVALAAAHEAIHISGSESDMRYSWALQQGRKALDCLQKHYATLSSASLLMAHILILALTTILDESLMYNAMKALYDLDIQMQQQLLEAPATMPVSDRFTITEHLRPIIDKQKSKLGSLVDILWSLQQSRASDFVSEPVHRINVPKVFRSTAHARVVLDHLLNSIAYATKTHMHGVAFPAVATQRMADWMAALGALQFRTLHRQHSEQAREICNIEMLRLSAQIYYMLITLMQAEADEMAFDGYAEVYRAIVRVAKHAITHKSTQGQTFTAIAMESSLVSFIGNAAGRWCRDPTIRQELFEILRQYKGREGYESAACWFDIANCMRQIEEGAVAGHPQTAEDFPETARVRLVGAEFFLRSRGRMAINYLQYPYGVDDKRTVILPYSGCGHYYTFDRFAEQMHRKPDVIIERGCTKWLPHDSSDEYYVVDQPKFCFRVTKV